MAILAVAKVGKDFRITVPKEVREYLKLSSGNDIIFYSLEDAKGRVCFRIG